jgi:hypothetical protein
MMSNTNNMNKFLVNGDYLPEFLKDFHDQKDFFKSLHHLYQDSEGAEDRPNWREGHIYTIDWLLWFMASRGYTLQKCRRKNITFKDLPNWREIQSAEVAGLDAILMKKLDNKAD